MNDAALARGHGAELVGRSGAANFFGGDGGCGAEFLDAERALILAVEGDLFVLSGGKVQHFEGEQFEGAEKLSTAIEEQWRVGSGEVDEDLRLLPVAIFGKWRIDDDAVFEAKSALGDDGLQKFVDLVGGGEFVGNGHEVSSQLSAVSFQLDGFIDEVRFLQRFYCAFRELILSG